MNTTKSDIANLSFDKEPELYDLSINDMNFHPIQKDDYYIKELLLVGINSTFLERSIALAPFLIISSGEIVYKDCFLSTKNKGNGTTSIIIKACYYANKYNETIEEEAFQEIKKGLILNQKKMTPKTLLCGFADGIGHLHYSITVPSDEIQNLMVQAKFFNTNLDKQIHNSFPNNSLLMPNALDYSPIAKIA